MLVEFAEEEEEKDGVKVPESHARGGVQQGRWGFRAVVLHEVFEKGEAGQEVAGNEEGFMVEGEGVKVAKSEGEEGRGGEEGGEAAEVAVEDCGDGVGEVREVGRRESGEGGHDYGMCGVDVVGHGRIIE